MCRSSQLADSITCCRKASTSAAPAPYSCTAAPLQLARQAACADVRGRKSVTTTRQKTSRLRKQMLPEGVHVCCSCSIKLHRYALQLARQAACAIQQPNSAS